MLGQCNSRFDTFINDFSVIFRRHGNTAVSAGSALAPTQKSRELENASPSGVALIYFTINYNMFSCYC